MPANPQETPSPEDGVRAALEGFIRDLTGSLRNRETMLTINHAALCARIEQAQRALSALPSPSEGWIATADRLPQKPGVEHYEHVWCLIYYHGEILLRPWNCEHLVWDDAEGDDFYCDPLAPTHWRPLPPPPGIPDSNQAESSPHPEYLRGIEEAAKVAESEPGILSESRSGGSFGSARADQCKIIANAIRALVGGE